MVCSGHWGMLWHPNHSADKEGWSGQHTRMIIGCFAGIVISSVQNLFALKMSFQLESLCSRDKKLKSNISFGSRQLP